MNKPRLLDLFCGAGGAAMGYHRAGFDVVGVDIKPQLRYPFRFVQADALRPPFRLEDFDVIHASPPCQAHSMFSRNMGTAERHLDLIPATREMLQASGVPWVIENVEGAPLMRPFMLCGSSFGLRVRRHRLFETGGVKFFLTPACQHDPNVLTVPVYGHGSPQWHRRKWGRNVRLDEKKDAMGIDWMTGWSLSQAIPPAYTTFIGKQLIAFLREPDDCEPGHKDDTFVSLDRDSHARRSRDQEGSVSSEHLNQEACEEIGGSSRRSQRHPDDRA